VVLERGKVVDERMMASGALEDREGRRVL